GDIGHSELCKLCLVSRGDPNVHDSHPAAGAQDADRFADCFLAPARPVMLCMAKSIEQLGPDDELATPASRLRVVANLVKAAPVLAPSALRELRGCASTRRRRRHYEQVRAAGWKACTTIPLGGGS